MIDSINTEAIFYSGSSTTKGGHKISLQVESRDIIESLEAMGAGKRYMLVLAPIGDDEQPEPIPAVTDKLKGGKFAQRAGIICGQPAFWKWVNDVEGIVVDSQETAAYFIRNQCRVSSRAELDHNGHAGMAFETILTEYEMWLGF